MMDRSAALQAVRAARVARGISYEDLATAVGTKDATYLAAVLHGQHRLNPEEAKKLARELNVEALITGTVQEFSQSRTAGAPSTSVSLVFRMIETDTGQVIWSSSISQSGVGAMARLFGVGGESATERARELIADCLKTLIR